MKYLISAIGFGMFVGTAVAQPSISGIVDGASYEAIVARGGIVSIFGQRLATATEAAINVPLPTKLSGTSVELNGTSLPLYFVSPTQINAQIPYDAPVLTDGYNFSATGTTGSPVNVSLAVRTSEGISKSKYVTVGEVAPAIFTRSMDGRGGAMLFNADFSPATSLVPGKTYITYATGLGEVSPSVPPGLGGASAEPLNRAIARIEVVAGEAVIDPFFAGLAPGFPGVYQVNFSLPSNFLPASDRFVLRGRGWISNTAQANYSVSTTSSDRVLDGTLDPVYPLPNLVNAPPSSGFGNKALYTPLLEIGHLQLRVARPQFNAKTVIAAVADGGRVIITINPSDPTSPCQAKLTAAPSVGTRQFQFLGTNIIPWDFAALGDSETTSRAIGLPFPGFTIPLTRIDPRALTGVSTIPAMQPDYTGKNANGEMDIECDPGAAEFIIDGTTNPQLANFGGFRQWIVGWTPQRTSTFQLFLNGALVSSKAIQYAVITRN